VFVVTLDGVSLDTPSKVTTNTYTYLIF